MYLPNEMTRIGRRVRADPKGEAIRMLIGGGLILLSLPLLHLFLKGTFVLAELLNTF